MSRGSPSYIANKRHGWDPMMSYNQPYESPRYFPHQDQELHSGYAQLIVEAPHHSRVRVMDYAIVTEPIKKFGHQVAEENVDKEAEDFIRFKHKKFGQCKLWN